MSAASTVEPNSSETPKTATESKPKPVTAKTKTTSNTEEKKEKEEEEVKLAIKAPVSTDPKQEVGKDQPVN
jgi:hypothetical protein